jgi:UDPglucose 6-dehydrogenase
VRLGVVGLGVVGSATAELLKAIGHEVVSYDLNGSGTCPSAEELAGTVAAAFVCVPTPSGLMGRLDYSNVRHACLQLRGVPLTVVRSTVPVGTCRKLHGNVVYWPEFGNARSMYDDMVVAPNVFLGGPGELTTKVHDFLTSDTPVGDLWRTIYHRPWEDVELLKLATNAAMATKIAFANEAAFLAAKLGADWGKVAEMLALDPRLGSVGWLVPGPDGKRGFGGACLPKDLAGYCAQGADVLVKTTLADAALAVNKRVRDPQPPKPRPPRCNCGAASDPAACGHHPDCPMKSIEG